MTDQPNGADGGTTRRHVLRIAGAGAAGLFGVAGATDEATAGACPRPPGYWADNDWPDTDRITSPLALADPADERSIAVWKLLLATPQDDPGAAMARQLLAARLNFQGRPPDDPGCVDAPLDAYDGRTVRELKIAARDWLQASNWPSEQPDWVVDGVDGEPLKEALAAFNDGGFAEVDCHCGSASGSETPGAGTAEQDHEREARGHDDGRRGFSP